MSFIDLVIQKASERGAKGTERVLLDLTSAAAEGGYKAPKPAEVIARLPHTTRKDQDSTPEVEPMVFVYALYLMVEFGYSVKDARRIANRFRTELDGYIVEGNVLLTRTNISKAEVAYTERQAADPVGKKLESLTRSITSFRKTLADGGSLSEEQELSLANLVSDLQTLITHSSRVEALV